MTSISLFSHRLLLNRVKGMVRKTLHSPFFTSVPRNSDLTNKPEVDDTFILPEDMAPAPKRKIPAGKFD